MFTNDCYDSTVRRTHFICSQTKLYILLLPYIPKLPTLAYFLHGIYLTSRIRVNIFQLTPDWNDELWDNRQNFWTTMLQQIFNSLLCKELVWMHNFTESIKKHGKVVVIIQFLNINLQDKNTLVINYVNILCILNCYVVLKMKKLILFLKTQQSYLVQPRNKRLFVKINSLIWKINYFFWKNNWAIHFLCGNFKTFYNYTESKFTF